MTATSRSAFYLDVQKWCERTKETADQFVRQTALELLSRVVLLSPVGNPELWKANKDVIAGRARYNADVDAVNAFIRTNPARLKYGKLRIQRHASPKAIAKKLPLNVGKGYVGGRFRGNWVVSIGAISTATTKKVDPSGEATMTRGAAVLEGARAGPPIYITNSLPYAVRLEYGWSTQAPGGMVRIAVAEFQAIVNEQLRALTA